MFLPHLRMCAVTLMLTCVAGAHAHTNERGLDALNFNTEVSACTDFFEYANGGWLKSNPIPAEYSQWSIDNEHDEHNLALLRDILEDTAKNPGTPGSNTQKVGDFYASAIDEAAIEAAGYDPIKEELTRVTAIKSTADVTALVREWQTRGMSILFSFSVDSDMKNATQAIGYAYQGGLGLPDRDYYLREDQKSKELLVKYRTHITRMLTLVGEKNAAEQAAWVMALETKLAKASLDRVALRTPENSYHMFTIKEADAKTPHFSWSAFFAEIGRSDVQRFSLAQPGFFTAVNKTLTQAPITHWQAYLRWHLLSSTAPYLSKHFVEADFDFYKRALRGTVELKPRWKRAIDATNDAIGEAVGEAYVARAFPPEAKERALILVGNLKTALRARIGKLEWMSEDTKKAAYAKLDTLVTKIGYPDQWRDYSKLTIKRGSYFANVQAATLFETQRQISKIDRPVDRLEWGMTPQMVNAYYNPTQNEIVFPAAQLQPPYFDVQMDDAVNYGDIGMIIGHEILHAFDDEGSQFDAKGNLRNWWSKTDRQGFDARTQKLVQQFNAYVPIDNLHINGKLTLGENIADIGGLQVAYDAFKLTNQGKSSEKIDGLTPDQRFFLSFAQGWRSAQRPETLRLQLQSNEHSPPKYRVNGPVSNLPVFATAFNCGANDAMARNIEARVQIW